MNSPETVIDIKNVTLTPETKCSACKGSTCCTYITQEIDKPRTKKDYSILLWQISHENIHVFRDEGTWYLLVDGKCSHLQSDGRCGIYETRPNICREHSNDYCELDAPAEEGFDLYFRDYDDLLKYCKKKFKNWDGKKSAKKSKKKGKKKSAKES